MNRHIVNGADLPVTITSLSNVWPKEQSSLVGGELAQMLVYLDGDADGDPSNAVLIASQPFAIPIPDENVRSVHPFDPPVLVDSEGDLYVGFADLQSAMDRTIRLMALQDDSGGGARSFIVYNMTSPEVDLNDLGNNEVVAPLSVVAPGAWLVRAEGACSEPSS